MIDVVIRTKPINDRYIVNYQNDDTLTISNTYKKLGKSRHDTHTYTFDKVFNEHHTNGHIFEKHILEKLKIALDSSIDFNCFLYGQTGSGKTYTLIGNENLNGILQYSIQYMLLYNQLHNQNNELHFSAFQIYNNKLTDLVSLKKLFVREKDHKMNICNLTKYKFNNIHEFIDIFNVALNNRIIGKTKINNNSSRSHSVYLIRFRNKIYRFIDLAGNEHSSNTVAKNRCSFNEYSQINKSLFDLKECIRNKHLKNKHIPFRNSKLTSVLRNIFLKKSINTMIITITPDKSSYHTSLDSLKYGSLIKNSHKSTNKSIIKKAFHNKHNINNIFNNCTTKEKLALKINQINNDKINFIKSQFNCPDECLALYKRLFDTENNILDGIIY